MHQKTLTFVGITFIVLLSFISCNKQTEEFSDPCRESCTYLPIPMCMMGITPTQKFIYNETIGQCEEYWGEGQGVPFQSLQECQACDCTQYVGQD